VHYILSRIILRAAEIRELSWDGTQYKVELEEACNQAAKMSHVPEMAEPVRCLLSNSWNQALDWANQHID